MNFQRTGKTSACSVNKVQETSRPDRLISRIKINSIDESAPRLTTLRAPKGNNVVDNHLNETLFNSILFCNSGPDGSAGFARRPSANME